MITLLAISLTSITFLLAAISKFRSPAATGESLRSFGVPDIVGRYLKTALPAAEVGVAVLLIVPTTVLIGAGAALVLLAVFSVAIGIQLAQGRNPTCSCFGALSNAPISYRTLVRNGLLALAPLAIVSGAVQWLDTLVSPSPLVVFLSVQAALILALAMVVVQLWFQQGRLLNRLEATQADPRPTTTLAQKVAHVDMDLAFRSLTGEPISARVFANGSRELAMVFVHPSCGPCRALIRDMDLRSESGARPSSVVFVSSGAESETRELFGKNVDAVVLADPDVPSSRFGVHGTPGALLIEPTGRVVGRANGRGAILSLLERLDRQVDQAGATKSTALSFGA